MQVYREDLELSCFSINCVPVPSLPPASPGARVASLHGVSLPLLPSFLHSRCGFPALCAFSPSFLPSFPLFCGQVQNPRISLEKAQYFAALPAGAVSAGRANPPGAALLRGELRRAAAGADRSAGSREGLTRLGEVGRSQPWIRGCSLGQAPMTHRLRRSHGQRDQNKVSVF